jgi:hypothetical protein
LTGGIGQRDAMIRFEARLFLTLQRLPGQGFNCAQQSDLVGADQRDRFAAGASASGATDAMDVVFGDDRQIEIDHLWQIVDIEAACRDIGGYQDLHFAGLEAFEGAQAGRLRLVAMDGVGADPFRLQGGDQLLGALACLDEDQHLTPTPVPE